VLRERETERERERERERRATGRENARERVRENDRQNEREGKRNRKTHTDIECVWVSGWCVLDVPYHLTAYVRCVCAVCVGERGRTRESLYVYLLSCVRVCVCA